MADSPTVDLSVPLSKKFVKLESDVSEEELIKKGAAERPPKQSFVASLFGAVMPPATEAAPGPKEEPEMGQKPR